MTPSRLRPDSRPRPDRRRPAMTTATKRRSVFDVPLPTIAYHGVRRPDEAHGIIAELRERQASDRARPVRGRPPLTHGLVRDCALRDSALRDAAGASAWPCRAVSPPARSGTGSPGRSARPRRRRITPAAAPPGLPGVHPAGRRARMRTACSRDHRRTRRPPHRRRPLRCRRRHRAGRTPCPIICTIARSAAGGPGPSFAD